MRGVVTFFIDSSAPVERERQGIMTSEASLQKTKPIPRGLGKQLNAQGWTWKATGAVFGLSCGIISPLIGSVLTAIAWFTGPVWHGFFIQRSGTVLLFLTIPLPFLAVIVLICWTKR